ncbi:MAG: tRNA (guanosine(46)-N7)-methyltransferase TrmB [Gammaproteobacteria bacterium]|nr:tRNA (guanosine(46)-N7)-methyltransferase TrmB [Gammaproteobacteria bacterium]
MSPSDGDNSEHAVIFPRKIRSFVRREGRMSKRQAVAYDSLFSHYGLSYNAQLLDFDALFGRAAPIILEIGFGMGDTLAAMAIKKPDTNYLGIEVHRPGIGNLLATIDEKRINNIRIFCHDAVEVLEHMIGDQSLDGIQIFFPDPWPKKRHHKRRLIQPSFITLLVQKLKSDGILHIATDWENYAQWIEDTMAISGYFSRLPDNTPHQRPTTKFEKRGRQLGHGVWEMIYVRKAGG